MKKMRMRERMKRLERVNNPEEITVDYAYKVLEAIIESLDRVSAKPEITKAFLYSIQQKYPDILDAVMAITPPEHREIVGRAVKSLSRVTGTWLKMGKML